MSVQESSQMMHPASATGQATSGSRTDPWWKLSLAGAVTIVSLVAFFVIVVYLMGKTDLADPAWTRSVYLLTGVEAITFAAVGWLFGKEVHRGQAESAEKRAESAEQQKDSAVHQAATEKAKGTVLAETVYSMANDRPSSNQLPSYESEGSDTPIEQSPSSMATLANLAVRLYPEVTLRRP